MVDEQQPEKIDSIKQGSGLVDAAQNQIGNMLSGVEKSLAITCESIMDKMKQLEDKIQTMENKYTELAADAEQALKEAEKVKETSDK